MEGNVHLSCFSSCSTSHWGEGMCVWMQEVPRTMSRMAVCSTSTCQCDASLSTSRMLNGLYSLYSGGVPCMRTCGVTKQWLKLSSHIYVIDFYFGV